MVREEQFAGPRPGAGLVAEWLGWLDKQVNRIEVPVQNLGEADNGVERELKISQLNKVEMRMVNTQLAVVFVEVLQRKISNLHTRAYLIGTLQDQLSGKFRFAGPVTSLGAVKILAEKQKKLIQSGESLQFWTEGVEMSSMAKNVAFKLHALQELAAPWLLADIDERGGGTVDYSVTAEDLPEPEGLMDAMVQEIMANQHRYRRLTRRLGPYRGSARAVDYLPAKKSPLAKYVELLPDHQVFEQILLEIGAFPSLVTPEAVVQVMKKESIKGLKKVPSRRPDGVEDWHFHRNRVELYWLLSGPGQLKVKRVDGRMHTYMPDPNRITAGLNLALLGARVDERGEPYVTYFHERFEPELGADCIWVKANDGRYVQFVIVRPGEVHDFQNQNVTPVGAYVLTLGLPRELGLSLAGDFVPVG